MSQPTGDSPGKSEFRPGPWGGLARSRNAIGVVLGVIAAWYPVDRGMEIYHHVMQGKECGFVCMYLFPAIGWWIVAFFLAFTVWLVVAVTLHRLGSAR